MKKIILAALALIILLSMALLPLSVSADESDVSDASDVSEAPTTVTRGENPNKFNVTVGSATAKQGDLVEIPVIVETNPGVWGFTLDVHYDENIMVLQSAVFTDEFKKDMTCIDLDNLSNDPDHTNYYIPFGLYAEGVSLTKNVTTTGLLATLTFLVIPGCDLGNTEISLTYKPNNVINVDGDNVLAAMYNGSVTVTEGKPAEPGVTYFPVRTTKLVNHTDETKTGLKDSTVFIILGGAVIVVGVVLAILVVRKPEGSGANTAKAAAAKPGSNEPKPARKKTEGDDASSEDDGIDDQA